MKFIFALIIFFTSTIATAEYYPALDYKVFGKPAIESDKVAIDELMDQFWLAWSAQDAQAVAKTHSDNAEWTNAFGRSFRGSNNLQTFLADRLFPMFEKTIASKEANTYIPVSRRYIGTSAAVVYGRVESDRGSSIGSSSRKIGFTFVLEKTDEQWKVVHQIITDLRERRGTSKSADR